MPPPLDDDDQGSTSSLPTPSASTTGYYDPDGFFVHTGEVTGGTTTGYYDPDGFFVHTGEGSGSTGSTPRYEHTDEGALEKVKESGFDLNKLLGGLKGLGSKAGSFLSTPSGLLTGLMGLYALSRLKQDSPSQYAGYKGSIPKLTASRTALSVPEYKPYSGQEVMGRQYFSPVTYAAEGGIMEGGEGRYLRGASDGMADEIPSSIDGEQPAKLSHGEFVIPADVVSDLGNGNSDAGAEVLYDMMDRVREARHGTTKQGKRIDPEKFTPGGIAGYSDGGAVAFQTGGGTGTAKITPGADGTPVSQTNTLSPWVGDYVTGMLGQGQALAQMPYQPYMGPISAGYSPLQQQAFQGLSSLQTPWQYGAGSGMAYQAGLGSFTQPGTSQAFMSPYMQDVVDVEKREAQRQADIARTQRGAQAVKSGAFGGSRQAIMDAEAQRNLAQQMGDIQTKGLQSAYDRAAQQYNAERNAQLQAAMGLGTLGTQQFGSQMQGLQGMLGAGGTQRDIEQQGIKASMDEYNRQMMWPYQQLQFQQSLLQGLPIGSTTAAGQTGAFGDIGRMLSGLGGIYGTLKGFGG